MKIFKLNNSPFFYNCRVYIEDTDQMGIVYHANYLRFYERARTELLRSYGLTLTDMASYDTYFSIYTADLKYILPARFDDMLKIKTNVGVEKNCSLLFNQEMYNQQDKILSTALIKVVCVNENLKPRRLPKVFFDF